VDVSADKVTQENVVNYLDRELLIV